MATDTNDTSEVAPGDVAGARRARRSFRCCVMACVLFAGTLWLSERYLRYELTESQYIAALTLAPESSRAILRSVVKRDVAQREKPTAKYIAALAEREEEDNILPTFKRACELEPNNASTLIRYGYALFRAEQYAEANMVFENVSRLLPRNPLPVYLEAATAALPGHGPTADAPGMEGREDFSGTLALIAKANLSDGEVVFPEPLWSPALPARGVWYAKLRRQIADECCAPLYAYADLVLSEVKHEISLRRVQYLESWLVVLENMGRRLAEVTNGGSIAVSAGVRIQIEALAQREVLAHADPGAAAKDSGGALEERRRKLADAMAQINDFEARRDQRIATARDAYVAPLMLCWGTLGVMLAVFALTWLCGRVLRADRATWALPHARSGIVMLVGGGVALLGLLAAASLAAQLGMTWPVAFVRLFWYLIVGVVLLFSLFYPRVALRRLALPTVSRGWYWKAYVSYWRRYCGTFAGLLLCAISVWIVGYRVAFGLYPFQIEVLVPGLESQEARVVQETVKAVSNAVGDVERQDARVVQQIVSLLD